MSRYPRARDRLILVRSVTENEFNPNDLKARILAHFKAPMPQMAHTVATLVDLCQSSFERDVFSALVERGYHVTPQVGSQGFSIDMVVEGEAGRRLAIECDGDRYHGPEKWADDMRRQRILERVGWTFWRCFGSNWSLDRDGVLEDLIQTLQRNEIHPIGAASSRSQYTEHRTMRGLLDDRLVDQGQGGSVIPMDLAVGDHWPSQSGTDSQLVVGDRVVIRYLDDPKAKPLCYILTNRSDDRINGYLSLSSALARALCEASPGDEILVDEGKSHRPILYMTLEHEIREVA